MPVFQSLEAFWPGVLSLVGDTNQAMRSIHNYHQVWKQYGFLPEFYNVAQQGAAAKREGFPLRPELAESAMYLYRSTKDPFLLTVGEDMFRSIEHSARTDCGYATIKDVRDHALEDRMESFFLAETTKYLYLLFDPDNFIHNSGTTATVIDTPYGECVVDAGGYVFNTEAHPIDPAALQCCSSHTETDIRQFVAQHIVDIAMGERSSLEQDNVLEEAFKGDTLSARMQQIQQKKQEDEARKQQEKVKYEKRMEEERAKEREAHKRRMAAEKESQELGPLELREERDKQQKYLLSEMQKVKQKTINVTTDVLNIKDSPNPPINSNSEISRLDLDVVKVDTLDAKNNEPEFDESKHDVGGDDTFKPTVLLKRQSKDDTSTAIEVDVDGTSKSNARVQFAETDSKGSIVAPTMRNSPEESSPRIPIGTESHEQGDENNGKLQKDKVVRKLDALYLLKKFNNLLNEFLGGEIGHPTKGKIKGGFDIDEFRATVMSDKRYELNKTWYQDYFMMSCPAKTFVERFCVQGEIFENV